MPMKNSAFAVDPCPKDLLGKQWLFMHMSAHYRRMFAAQSVVDSSPPAALAVLKERVSLASAAGKSSRASRVSRAGSSGSASRSVSSASKPHPSRADADSGGGVGPTVLEGRSSPSSQPSPRRHGKSAPAYSGVLLGKAPLLPKHGRRNPERPDTYFDKLNQLVPDHGRGRCGTRHGVLSEVFTPPVPYKPQVLRTEVPSRLRFSNAYCPPRPKQIRPKSAVPGQEMSKDEGQAVWTKLRPPVSSRDSAYNGGISSGGESRGPTPDQKGSRKHSKKSGKKGKAKSKQPRVYSAEAKTRRKLENILKKKLLEEERNEIQEHRLCVDPWRGINQDDHGDEILRNRYISQIDSHEDDSLTENGSPLNTSSHVDDGSQSDQSVEEDMAEETQDTLEEELDKEEDADVSLAKDASLTSLESMTNQSPSKSSTVSKKLQVGTQTEPSDIINQLATFSSSVRPPNNASPSHSTGSSSKESAATPSSHSKHSSPEHQTSHSSDTADEPTRASKISQARLGDRSILSLNKKNPKLDQSKIFSIPGDYVIPMEQQDRLNCTLKAWPHDETYQQFVCDITRDMRIRHLVTNKGLRAVFQEHIEANRGKLDMVRMQHEVDKLCLQLNIPRNENLDSLNYGVGPLTKMQESNLEIFKTHLDEDTISPIISCPSQFWTSDGLTDQPPPVKYTLNLHSSGKHFVPKNILAQNVDHKMDGPRKPINISEEEPIVYNSLKNSEVALSKLSKHTVNLHLEKIETNPKDLQDVASNKSLSQISANPSQIIHTNYSNFKGGSVFTTAIPSLQFEGRNSEVMVSEDTCQMPSNDISSPLYEKSSNVSASSVSTVLGNTRKSSAFLNTPVKCLSSVDKAGPEKDETDLLPKSCHHRSESKCMCGEENCRCANSGFIKAYMKNWQEQALEEESLERVPCKKLIDTLVDASNPRVRSISDSEHHSEPSPGATCKCLQQNGVNKGVFGATREDERENMTLQAPTNSSSQIPFDNKIVSIFEKGSSFSSTDSVTDGLAAPCNLPKDTPKRTFNKKKKTLAPCIDKYDTEEKNVVEALLSTSHQPTPLSKEDPNNSLVIDHISATISVEQASSSLPFGTGTNSDCLKENKNKEPSPYLKDDCSNSVA